MFENRSKIGRAMVAVYPEDLVKMQAGRTFRVESTDVPEGAKFLHAGYCPESGYVLVCIEHESLQITAPGASLPRLNGPVFKEVGEEEGT